ncbi:MAG TPA: adenylate/guanylate cyclase domain-containing protein [Candidatus Limnocylindrales bacterium]
MAATPTPATSVPPGGPATTPSGGERRLVSVLFADLVGFTPFAEERDAEEIRDVLSRYFEIASDVIARYGGTVEKFIGDAVMAVWGTPVAHEDDAERSVRAALELVDAVRALGPTIQARAGILTGEAAVTLGATNQGMVAGDMVNTAARLQAVAAPGTVLVGESTARATEAAIAYEPLGDQTLKGKTAPVAAWRAVRVVAERGGRNRADTLEAPFVGRDEELRLLKDLFHATSREGRARLVSIVGPAGIGKSRLAWEFTKYLDGVTEDIYWHDGRSPAYGEGVTFWALGEMVRERARLAESDDEPTTRQKVAASVASIVPDETERRWVESALLALLGLGTSLPPDQLFAAWRTYFERLASTGSVVMVFEDLHWADAGTIDFIEHLLERAKASPIYVVTLARPELLERRPDWGAAKRNFVSSFLEPLPPPAMRALLAGLVPGLPEEATAVIVERADGIPLYAVETVRMLVARGQIVARDGVYRPVGDLTVVAVPDTLTALIGARLDGLHPVDRTLLQHAAIMGQSFSVEALSAVSGVGSADLGARLSGLVRRELLTIQADPRSPERGHYAFVQSLIREVAYNTLSRKDRKAGHLAAARYFETVGSDELAGALATHYLAAHANSPDGPEADAVAAQARLALRGAAERAIELGSLAQAATFYDQARAITTAPADVAELLELAGKAADDGGLGDLADDRLHAALDLRRRGTDDAAELRATVSLARSLITHFKIDEARDLLEPGVARWAPDGATLDTDRVALLGQLARVAFFLYQNERSVQVADRALPAAERLDALALIADLLITRGSALSNLGRYHEGQGAKRAGIRIADENGFTLLSLRGVTNLSAAEGGDPAAAYAIARQGFETATRVGRHGVARTLLINATSNAIEVGDWDWAFASWAEELDRSTDESNRLLARWNLADLRTFRGEEVGDEIAAVLAWAKASGDSSLVSGIGSLSADLAVAEGRLTEAADLLITTGRLDSLNAPEMARLAGTLALIAEDPVRAGQALELLDATRTHRRVWNLDRRLIAAGVAALTAPTGSEARTCRETIEAYRDLGLPYRQVMGTLMLAASFGTDDPANRDFIEEAEAIIERLGAVPMARQLERLRARPAAAEGRTRVAARPTSAPAAVVRD